MIAVDGIETCREPFDADMFEAGTKPHLVQDGTMSEYVHVRKRGNVCDHSQIGHVLCPFTEVRSTTIAILDQGKVPILFSIQQMRNLEFELARTAAGEFPYLPENWSEELSVVRVNFRPYRS